MTDSTGKRFQSGGEVLSHFVPNYTPNATPEDRGFTHDSIENSGGRLGHALALELKAELAKLATPTGKAT